MYREGELSIVMREAGILCVTVAGVKKMQEWSVKRSVMIRLFLVMSATLCNNIDFIQLYHYISEPVIANFGRGTRPILPKDIECTVDDDTLSGCATTDLDISQCQHEAGVICVGVRIHVYIML